MALPVIVDPTTFDKQVVATQTLELCKEFLVQNEVSPIKWFSFDKDEAALKKPPGKNFWHEYGFWWEQGIFANIKRSRPPTKTPGFAWSYTASKSDLTIAGIIAHEFGHHTHFTLEETGGRVVRTDILNKLRDVRRLEKKLTSYEPNSYETWAEAMRVFILNPTLLLEARPKRYELITDFGLRPVHDVHWREVLKHAHPKIISSIEKAIDNAL